MKSVAVAILLIFTTLESVYSQSISQQIIDSLDIERQKEYLKIADPATGKIPYGELEKAREEITKRTAGKQTNAAISPSLTWYERGPKNGGGNIRCLVKDPNDPTGKKVWAGSAHGGLWYNNDITSASSTWTQVVGGDNWPSINISSIAFNPSNSLEMYVGTGDYRDFPTVSGSGIYKSTDGGATFTQLSSTIPNSSIIGTQGYAFQFVNKLIVNSSGYIFANTWNGLLKSTDGGATWNFLLNSQIGSDLEIGNDGILYASFGYGNSNNSARIYRSTDATGTNWTDISPSNIGYRTEIALANSTGQASQVIYALAANGGVIWFKKSTNGGTSWTDLPVPVSPFSPTVDFLSYYSSSISMLVHPDNPNVVYAGGGFLVKSIDGGANWSIYNNSLVGLNSMVLVGNLTGLVLGGGIEVLYSTDAGATNSTNFIFNNRNLGLRIQKATSVSMPNVADNGAVFGSSYSVSGALHTIGTANSNFGNSDGTIFIDQDNPNVIISNSSLYNSNITYVTNLINSNSLTYYDYDSPNNIFYAFNTANSSANTTTFYRTTDVGTTNNKSTFTVNTLMNPTFIKAGKTPHTLFVGSFLGKLYKISNIDTSPVVTQIDNNQLPNGSSSVSSIDIGVDDNEILITYSNYGISSVWYTTNGGTTWVNKDENGHGLPNIPVRYGKLIKLSPTSTSKVALATELGVFTTDNIQDSNPAWEISNTGLPNVRCNSIYYRPADSVLAVATQGRGIFISPMRGFFNPNIQNEFNKGVLCKSGSTTIPFSTIGTFANGTVFNVELSNSSGSFASPTIIGSGTSSPISVTLSASLASSNNYKLRIVTAGANPKISNESAFFAIMASNGINLYVTAIPNTVNGSYQFCEGSTVNISSYMSNITNYNLLQYNWTGPNGFTSAERNLIIANATASNAGIYTVSTTIESCQTYSTTVSLAKTTSPTVVASGTNIACPGTTIYLNSASNVFSNAVQYSWGGPNNFTSTAQYTSIASATNASGGIYTVTGTFTGGCNLTTTATVNVAISNNLPISTYYNGTSCNGSTVSLYGYINTSTNGLTIAYSWAGPNGFTSSVQNPAISNFSAVNAGVYTVTATYSGSCSGTSTTTLNISLTNLIVNINGSTQYCSGATTNLVASLSNSGYSTSYTWAGPNGFSSTGSTLSAVMASATNAGVYTVTAVYSGSCNGTATATINVSLSSVSAYVNGGYSYCSGATTNNYVSFNYAGLSAMYSWTGPNSFSSTSSTLNISNFSTLNTGPYTVTVVYSGNCSGTTTLNFNLSVSPPQIFANSGGQYCQGASVALSAGYNGSSPTSYSWSGPNGFTSTSANPSVNNFDASKAGIYTVTAIFGNGCNVTLTATTAITLATTVPPHYISHNFIGGEYCLNNGGINLSITNNSNFSSSNINSVAWMGPNGFSSNSFQTNISTSSLNNSGVYTASISFIGCAGTVTATTNVNISSSPKVSAFILSNGNYPNIFVQANKQVDVCEGNYFMIEAITNNGGSATYAWTGPMGFTSTNSFNYFSPPTNVNRAGVYTVTATLTGACAGTATSIVQLNFNNSNLAAPQITASPQTYRAGELVTLTANCSGGVQWSNGGSNTTNILTLTPASNQSIYANCFDIPSCLSPSSNRIVFTNCQGSFTQFGSFFNTSAKYESSGTITGANKIIPVSNITYDAQNSVILNPGFEVQAGSVFKAQIDGCGNN